MDDWGNCEVPETIEMMPKQPPNDFLWDFSIEKRYRPYNTKSPLADFSKCDHKDKFDRKSQCLTKKSNFVPNLRLTKFANGDTFYEVFVDVLSNQTQGKR